MKKQYLFAVQVTIEDEKQMDEASIARNLMYWLESSPFQIDAIHPLDKMNIYNPKEKTSDERLSLLDIPMAVITPEVIREQILTLRDIGYAGDYSDLLDEICQRNGITLSDEQRKELLK